MYWGRPSLWFSAIAAARLLHKALELAENHFTRRSLKRTGYADKQVPANLISGAFDDNHRPVIKITDTLFDFFPGLYYLDFHCLTGQSNNFQRIRQIVDIHHVNFANLRYLT
jgi:hypothetical protein